MFFSCVPYAVSALPCGTAIDRNAAYSLDQMLVDLVRRRDRETEIDRATGDIVENNCSDRERLAAGPRILNKPERTDAVRLFDGVQLAQRPKPVRRVFGGSQLLSIFRRRTFDVKQPVARDA